jgi:4-aminobutyrate aminotransferase-like enzyme
MNNVIERARKMGLIIKTMGHALEFAPPLVIQKSEIDEALEIIEACIRTEGKEMGL